MIEPAFTGVTADDVQRGAEAICYHTHGNQCAAWGQAVVLLNHGPGSVAALSTIGPILDRYIIPGFSVEPAEEA